MNETGFQWARIGADANGDGSITIADSGIWLMDLAILPGDALIYLVLTYAPALAEFLELSSADFGSTYAFGAGAIIWIASLLAVATFISFIRELDRRATTWLAGRYMSGLSRLRAIRRRLQTFVTSRLIRRRASSNGFSVDAISLAASETVVLRCLSSEQDNSVLTLDEIALKVKRPAKEISRVIRHLRELELIEPCQDKRLRKDGHRIAAAGQLYLLGT